MQKFDEKDNISEKTLLLLPFSLYCGEIMLPMEQIYLNSKEYTENLSDFEIEKQKYDIIFEKIDNFECRMKLYIKEVYNFSWLLLYKPITLNIEDLNLSSKNIKLYSERQLKQMIYAFKLRYNFVDSDNQILDETKSYKSLEKVVILKKKLYDINNQAFLDTIMDYKYFSEKETSNIVEINPYLLSYNFYKIFPEYIEKEKKFKLIINNERNKFLESISNFIKSNKQFLWIVGADGIGKSISLMYYTIKSNENVLYFNLKLFNEKNKNPMEFFANDIIKFYYLKKKNIDFETLNDNKNELLYILKHIFNSQNSEESLAEKFWKSLTKVIDEISMLNIGQTLIIILDQYKNLSIDDNYNSINNFLYFIKEKYPHKIIFSSSINNKNIQSIFFNNIGNFSFYSDYAEIDISDFDTNSINRDIYDVKQESEYYENILKKKEIKSINENDEISPDYSLLSLNNDLKDYTLKIYYPFLISGKDLSTNFKDEEIKCFQNFHYNLKYINKYIFFKEEYIKNKKNKENNKTKNLKKEEKIFIQLLTNDTKEKVSEKEQNLLENQIENNTNDQKSEEVKNEIKMNNEKDKNEIEIEKEIPKIIEAFYEHCRIHITSKINGFYSGIDDENIDNITLFECEKLMELQEIIFSGKSFSISELRKKMHYYPGKYLNIYKQKNIFIRPNDNTEISNYYLDYSNIFFKFTINALIQKLERELEFNNNDFGGSGAGVIFEKKVINSILYNSETVFGQLKYENRRVFSLVGKTENSKNTVELHRNEEKNNTLYKFYSIIEYLEKIDDIDFKKGDEQIKLSKNLYLITQVSRNGRSFDFAILYKINNSNDWNLYLFQVTINKKGELKTKAQYSHDSDLCGAYLSKLYGINIIKKFLIFVLPFNTCETSFINMLENREIFYIFYKFGKFYNKSNFIIGNLNFSGAEITSQNKNDLYIDLYNIQKSLNAWDDSVNQFIKRKRKAQKLYKYYNKNLSYINGRGLKLNLPREMRIEIIKAITNKELLFEESYELLFIGNCKCKNIIDVNKETGLLIFFVFNDIYYFYYKEYYQYKDNKFIKINETPKIEFKRIIKMPNYEKISIDLSDIKGSINLCFCFSLLS